MTAIGSLDIFFGILGTLLSILVIFGGIQINTALEDVDDHLQQATNREFFTQRVTNLASRTETELHAAHEMILPDGIVSASLSLLLIIAGIGTLGLRFWARWMSLAWSTLCIAWVCFVTFFNPVDFSYTGWGILVYPIVLIICFNFSHWKKAFSRSGGEPLAAS